MSDHDDKLRKLRELRKAAEEMETEELTLLERLWILPFQIAGELFFWFIVQEKKRPRKDFSSHTAAVKAAAERNRKQREREQESK